MFNQKTTLLIPSVIHSGSWTECGKTMLADPITGNWACLYALLKSLHTWWWNQLSTHPTQFRSWPKPRFDRKSDSHVIPSLVIGYAKSKQQRLTNTRQTCWLGNITGAAEIVTHCVGNDPFFIQPVIKTATENGAADRPFQWQQAKIHISQTWSRAPHTSTDGPKATIKKIKISIIIDLKATLLMKLMK